MSMKDTIVRQAMNFLARRNGFRMLVERTPPGTESPSFGELRSHIRRFRDAKGRGPIYLVALPKAGGSWLVAMVSQVTGMINARKPLIKQLSPCSEAPWDMLHPHFTDMTDLTDEAAQFFRGKAAIVHIHPAPTADNIRKMREADWRCLFLVRDLRDVMVSLYHHLMRRSEAHRKRFEAVSQEEGLDMVLQEFLEPFSLFLEKWTAVAEADGFLMVRYEDLLADPAGELKRIAEFYGVETEDDVIERTVERFDAARIKARSSLGREQFFSNIKLRSGKSGGWQKDLTEAQARRISNCAGGAITCCETPEAVVGWTGD